MNSAMIPRRLRGQLRSSFWILAFYENQKAINPDAAPLRRLLSRTSRERWRLILRAQWHGFDVNETIYLLSLLDDAADADVAQARTLRA